MQKNVKEKTFGRNRATVFTAKKVRTMDPETNTDKVAKTGMSDSKIKERLTETLRVKEKIDYEH